MIHNIFEINNKGHPTPFSIDINQYFAWFVAVPSSILENLKEFHKEMTVYFEKLGHLFNPY